VISSLTIWKADKTIFKIVCKVLKVFLIEYSKQHIQVFLGFAKAKHIWVRQNRKLSRSFK